MPPAPRSTAAEISSAATSLVAEEGLRGLSLRKVAARAGVSLGGMSYQVGGKADLVRQLVRDANGTANGWPAPAAPTWPNLRCWPP
jgi:AcrR family transcriptional regulator